MAAEYQSGYVCTKWQQGTSLGMYLQNGSRVPVWVCMYKMAAGYQSGYVCTKWQQGTSLGMFETKWQQGTRVVTRKKIKEGGIRVIEPVVD